MAQSFADLRGNRTTLIAAILTASLLGFVATSPGEAARAVQAAGPELTRLLRGMALIKALMAAIMAVAVFWRLQFPIPPVRLAAYITACAAMAAGPFLVWDMAHIIGGAVLLHAGLLAAVLLGWRDDVASEAVMGRMLRPKALRRAARVPGDRQGVGAASPLR
jgi:hypothetical protein